MSEESNNDVVKEARELLGKITPWPWDAKRGNHCWHVGSLDGTFETSCIMFAGGKGTSEGNAKFIARAPELLSALCDEVEELRRRNSTQEESITHLQSQFRVMKEAIRAAIEFADLSQRCSHNCGPNCSAEGKSRMLRAEALSIQLRDSITPKGSEQ